MRGLHGGVPATTLFGVFPVLLHRGLLTAAGVAAPMRINQTRRHSDMTDTTTTRLQHMDVTDDPDAIFEVFLRDGAVIVENFLSKEQLDRINAELDPYIEQADPLMRNVYDFEFGMGDQIDTDMSAAVDTEESFMSGNTRNVTGLAAKSPTFGNEIIIHPTYMALCDRMFKPQSHDYILNHGHLINVGPGAKGQPIHRDEGIWASMKGLGVGSHLQFASIVALVDFYEDNGATKVVPGSHLWPGDPFGGEGRYPEKSEIQQAVMPAGSAVLYTGWTFHGAGQNRTTDSWRRGLHVSYCQGWLRTEENNTLAVPPDVARNLPVRAQEMLGYGVHQGLGMLGLRSPIDQMRDGII
jgi:ectoine hydroxylase-related dioxygenase (phytanoyl-CoA dioxygenase family)